LDGSSACIVFDQCEHGFGAAIFAAAIKRVRVGDGLGDDELAVGAQRAQRRRRLVFEGGLETDIVEDMVSAIGDDQEELVAFFLHVALELRLGDADERRGVGDDMARELSGAVLERGATELLVDLRGGLRREGLEVGVITPRLWDLCRDHFLFGQGKGFVGRWGLVSAMGGHGVSRRVDLLQRGPEPGVGRHLVIARVRRCVGWLRYEGL
jgi:hypothetical protein